MNQLEATVIIAIYNKFNFLEKVLAGLEVQTEKAFEVILADDGSNSETQQLIQEYMAGTPLLIRHVWQPDRGFCKNIMLNEAVLQAKTNYLIFLDGDCIPHPRFVAAHINNREENTILSGRRVNLSPKISDALTPENIRAGKLDKMLLPTLADSVLGKTRDAEKGIDLAAMPLLAPLLKPKFRGLLGCNFSMWKQDLEEINGFDERYTTPAAGEDTDPEIRLKWIGKKFKSVNYQAIQYHLYHKLLPRPEASQRLLQKVIEEKQAVTAYGLKQHQLLS